MLKGSFISEFAQEYQRNNKVSGSKNVRCFPSCCPRGHRASCFCGQPVKFVVGFSPNEMASVSLRFLLVGEFTLQTLENSVVIPLVTGDSSVPDNIFNDLILTKTQRLNPLFASRFVTEGDQLVAVFNEGNCGWHYRWLGTHDTCDNLHSFVVHVFERIPENRLRFCTSFSSSPFRIFSRKRMFRAKAAKKQPTPPLAKKLQAVGDGPSSHPHPPHKAVKREKPMVVSPEMLDDHFNNSRRLGRPIPVTPDLVASHGKGIVKQPTVGNPYASHVAPYPGVYQQQGSTPPMNVEKMPIGVEYPSSRVPSKPGFYEHHQTPGLPMESPQLFFPGPLGVSPRGAPPLVPKPAPHQQLTHPNFPIMQQHSLPADSMQFQSPYAEAHGRDIRPPHIHPVQAVARESQPLMSLGTRPTNANLEAEATTPLKYSSPGPPSVTSDASGVPDNDIIQLPKDQTLPKDTNEKVHLIIQAVFSGAHQRWEKEKQLEMDRDGVKPERPQSGSDMHQDELGWVDDGINGNDDFLSEFIALSGDMAPLPSSQLVQPLSFLEECDADAHRALSAYANFVFTSDTVHHAIRDAMLEILSTHQGAMLARKVFTKELTVEDFCKDEKLCGIAQVWISKLHGTNAHVTVKFFEDYGFPIDIWDWKGLVSARKDIDIPPESDQNAVYIDNFEVCRIVVRSLAQYYGFGLQTQMLRHQTTPPLTQLEGVWKMESLHGGVDKFAVLLTKSTDEFVCKMKFDSMSHMFKEITLHVDHEKFTLGGTHFMLGFPFHEYLLDGKSHNIDWTWAPSRTKTEIQHYHAWMDGSIAKILWHMDGWGSDDSESCTYYFLRQFSVDPKGTLVVCCEYYLVPNSLAMSSLLPKDWNWEILSSLVKTCVMIEFSRVVRP